MNMDMDALKKKLINHLFWAQTLDYNTSAFETPENLAVVEIAINIAKCQLPALMREGLSTRKERGGWRIYYRPSVLMELDKRLRYSQFL